VACEALEMKGPAERPDKLSCEMRAAFSTHALLLYCPTGSPVATSCPVCQLLLTVRVLHSLRRFLLRLLSCFPISTVLSSVCQAGMGRVVRSRGIVIVECAI
jgi:hypothetical protein